MATPKSSRRGEGSIRRTNGTVPVQLSARAVIKSRQDDRGSSFQDGMPRAGAELQFEAMTADLRRRSKGPMKIADDEESYLARRSKVKQNREGLVNQCQFQLPSFRKDQT